MSGLMSGLRALRGSLAAKGEREKQSWPQPLRGLGLEAGALVIVLCSGPVGGVFVSDLRDAVGSRQSDSGFDAGLGELARRGLVEVTTAIGEDGKRVPESIVRLRVDVDLPDPP